MTMNDYSYKDTKLILKGKKKLNIVLCELAKWITVEYNAKVLNIYYDTFTVDKSQRPRLEIVLEKRMEIDIFLHKGFTYDTVKKKRIIDELSAIMKKQKCFFLKKRISYDTTNMSLVFSAFLPAALSEANNKVSTEEINEIKNSFKNDYVWEISKCFDSATIFFYTEKQALNNQDTILKEKIETMYFNFIKKYDEFGYLNRETFKMNVDSKENLDKNYAGNWYYYYK